MTYNPGDPGHINVHNDLRTSVANLAASTAVTVVLPPVRNLGDSGHVDDHNLYTTAIQKIADEAQAPVAAISSPAPSGQYTDSNGDTWDYYEFTASGSLTVDRAGWVECLIVSGGGGGKAAYYEGTGSWLIGTYEFAAATHTVTVGAGGSGNDQTSAQNGSPSSLGSVAARYGGAAPGVGGSNGGVNSDITGTSIGYAYHAQASPRTNRGDGASSGTNGNGSSGIVIARVKV